MNKGADVFTSLCMSACLHVRKITQKVINESTKFYSGREWNVVPVSIDYIFLTIRL